MLPMTSKLFDVEMIRDGGSLAVTFGSDDGNRYILFFPIQIVDRGAPAEQGTIVKERLGYEQPIIIDCDPAKRPPDTDNVIHSELAGPKVSVTWSDARVLIGNIKGLAVALGEGPTKWLRMIEFVTEHEGRLPPGIEAVWNWRLPGTAHNSQQA
jgi:hypothetical protein